MSISRWTGLFILSLALVACGDDDPARVCGDGTVDEGEACDDGNDVDTDACRNDCTEPTGPFCGDGNTDAGEECDDGNDIDTDACKNDCTEPVTGPFCGDGNTDAGEECDDGNDIQNDGCDNDCTMSESTKVIERALAAGHRPRSVLLQAKWLDELSPLLAEHDVPVYLGEPDLLERVAEGREPAGLSRERHGRCGPGNMLASVPTQPSIC